MSGNFFFFQVIMYVCEHDCKNLSHLPRREAIILSTRGVHLKVCTSADLHAHTHTASRCYCFIHHFSMVSGPWVPTPTYRCTGCIGGRVHGSGCMCLLSESCIYSKRVCLSHTFLFMKKVDRCVIYLQASVIYCHLCDSLETQFKWRND